MMLFFTMSAVAAAAAEPVEARADWAGYYSGNQMELAAGLVLSVDGRFEYGLAYGALNEGAEGAWAFEGDRILLTSDPVTAPEFRLTEQAVGLPGELVVALEPPSGLPVQLFDLTVLFADGERLDHSISSGEEVISFEASRPPVSVQLSLPMFDLLSTPTALPVSSGGEGYVLRFLFEPNDLGKIAFESTPLRIEDGALLLERHDRLVRFRRAESVP